MLLKRLILLAALMTAPFAAPAQQDEVIVTAQRVMQQDFDEEAPLIGLRRTADFAVRAVKITGDTREAPKRRDEIFAMVRNAIEVAGRQGVELSTGDVVLVPLTLANYRDLALVGDNRPDTERVSFYAKSALAGSDAKAALDKIERFIKAVPSVGRAELLPVGNLTLSVVNPDQYRAEIVGLIAADANMIAARLGADYGVEAGGLDKRVLWSREGLTNVFLYVPYNYRVVRR